MAESLICNAGFQPSNTSGGSTDDNHFTQTISMGSPTLTNRLAPTYDDTYAYVWTSSDISLTKYTKVISAKFNPTSISLSWQNSSMNTSTYYIRAVFHIYGLYSQTLIGNIQGIQCPQYSIQLPSIDQTTSEVITSQSFYIRAEMCIAKLVSSSYRQQDCTNVFTPSAFSIACDIEFL